MKRIFAIAALAARGAVRSRVVVVLLGVLLLAIIGLPLTVKGDGTPTGEARVLLSYTLGMVHLILAVATVWAGCAAVALDVQQRQIQLVLAKPVRRVEVWLGKWLGLLALNAALLLFSGAIVFGLLLGRARTDVTGLERILTAERRVLPDLSEIDEAARLTVEQQIQANAMPPQAAPDQFYQVVRDSMLQQANTVPVGLMTRWVFRLPAPPTPDQSLTIRYKFASSKIEKAAVTGLWRVGAPAATQFFENRVTAEPDKEQFITLPPGVGGKDGVVLVEFGNVNPTPVTLLFAPQAGVELRVEAGTFAANYVRSLLVVFGQLAFVAALAVTMGALVSLPVAAFVTTGLLVLIKAAGYVESLANQPLPVLAAGSMNEPALGVVDWAVRGILRGLATVLRPLQTVNPLEQLAAGQLVGWESVGRVLVIDVVLYGGVLAVVGVWLFNRREIALPS